MSARETGGTRRNTSATRHRHADDIEGGGGGYNRTPQYQDSDDDEPRQRKGEESACETFQKVSMGWLVVLLLGCLWYSEHVSMRRELGQLQTELTLLQADYTRVSVRTAGDEFKIETLAGKIDGGNEALVAPSPADLAGVGDGFPAPPAADPHTALQAATPAAAQDVPHPAGGGTCVSWRQVWRTGPFDTVGLPLNYSSNSGVNDISCRGSRSVNPCAVYLHSHALHGDSSGRARLFLTR